MSETVFILGAGASQKAGAPLMKEFLDVAENLHKNNVVPNANEDFQLVFDGCHELRATTTYANLDLDNIESVFAAFEMAKLLGQLGKLDQGKLNRLPIAMIKTIVATLEAKISFPASKRHVRPPNPYEEFVSLIRDLRSNGRAQSVSIITFNYDLCLDYALHHNRLPVNYCLGQEGGGDGIKYLKLHGSLNWIKCQGCNQVVPWNLSDYFQKYNWNFWDDESKSVPFHVASYLANFKHCGEKTSSEPMIVPPTWNKGAHQNELKLVWQAAAHELATAENIFIIGYSLPETDQFFRHLYALGTSLGRARIKRIWVCDPSEQVFGRFKVLLGQSGISRFHGMRYNFDDAVGFIRAELRDSIKK